MYVYSYTCVCNLRCIFCPISSLLECFWALLCELPSVAVHMNASMCSLWLSLLREGAAGQEWDPESDLHQLQASVLLLAAKLLAQTHTIFPLDPLFAAMSLETLLQCPLRLMVSDETSETAADDLSHVFHTLRSTGWCQQRVPFLVHALDSCLKQSLFSRISSMPMKVGGVILYP